MAVIIHKGKKLIEGFNEKVIEGLIEHEFVSLSAYTDKCIPSKKKK